MKVILINPNHSGIEKSIKISPLGISYIAAVLEENEIRVKVIDMIALGMERNELERELKTENPQIVGITCLTPFANVVSDIAKMVKETTNAIVVIGGAHATALPHEVSKDENIDYVVLGEGEYTFLELAKSILDGKNPSVEKIRGVGFFSDGGYVQTEPREYIQNLDELPYPARHLLPMEQYSSPQLEGKRIMSIVTSRGCPYNCTFCDYRFLMGPKFRRRSVECVVNEIEECITKYNTDFINFRDSTFTYNEEWITDFCQMIKERDLDIKWDCNGRVNLVTKNMLRQMKDAGCTLISYGIESGDQCILDAINKKITVEQSIEAVKMTKEAGIEVLSYFIIGLPEETKGTINKTIKLAIKLDSDYTEFSAATPYPGTPLFTYGNKHELIKDVPWDDYFLTNNPIMRTEELDYDELDKAIKLAYRKFYLRPRYIMRRARKLNLHNFMNNVKGFRMFLDMVRGGAESKKIS